MTELILDRNRQNNLPLTWTVCKLEDICNEINPGFPSGKHNKAKRGIPHLRPMNIDFNGNIVLSEVKYVQTNSYDSLKSGDVLFNNTNSPKLLGKTALIKEDTNWAYSNHMTRIRFDSTLIEPHWLAYYLHKLFWEGYYKLRATNHVNQSSINSTFLSKKVPILLAPLNEQKRIVSKIEELFSILDTNLIRLKKTKKQIHNYTQSLLKNAFEGKLSKDWRKNNLDKVSRVSDFTNKIHEAQSKSDVDFITKLTPLDKSKLFNLPSTWIWLRIGDITNMVSGKAFKKKEYSAQGVRLFQIANVSFGKILWESLAYLPKNYLEKYPHLELKSGDILLALNRPLLEGMLKIGKLDDDDVPSILYQRVGRFDFYSNKIKDFFYFYLQSPIFINLLSKSLQGVDQPFINKPKLLQLPIPLPTLEEQKIITEIIKSQQSIIDYTFNLMFQIINKIKSNKQSILKSAFEGNLIPQNPNDEPAKILLKKIKLEKEKLDQKQKIIKSKSQKKRRKNVK